MLEVQLDHWTECLKSKWENIPAFICWILDFSLKSHSFSHTIALPLTHSDLKSWITSKLFKLGPPNLATFPKLFLIFYKVIVTINGIQAFFVSSLSKKTWVYYDQMADSELNFQQCLFSSESRIFFFCLLSILHTQIKFFVKNTSIYTSFN